ncbi:MAG: nuclear transport factor 2 family protein [Cyclobacteriaceae bacterium]
MTHKEIATSFLQSAGMGEVKAAFEQSVADNFIHHNQYFKGDRESLKAAMQEAQNTSPNKSITIKNTYEDGDTVITHSHVVKEDMEIAVVHIFRFDNNKIVELWDLGQIIDKDSPNEHGLF